MERIGPIMMAIGCLSDVLAAGLVWADPTVATDLGIAFNGAALAGVLLAFGGGWLTILWGEADRDLLVYCGMAIAAHIIALIGIAFLPLGPVISGLAFVVVALTVGIATTHAWRATNPDTLAPG